MSLLSNIGRAFYGASLAGMGFLTIYYHDFCYFLLPPKHSWIPAVAVYVLGSLLILAGIYIGFGIKGRITSLLLGIILLAIFCFYFVPYKFTISPNYTRLLGWENAQKELALAGGAFAMALCFSNTNSALVVRFLNKLIPVGIICFGAMMIIFGSFHLKYANQVSELVPNWIPQPVFWTYLAGVGLIGSGVSIIFKIKTRLIAALLGTIILIWVVILHIPRVVAAPAAEINGETASGLLALAYSGTAFVIAGTSKKTVN